MKMSFELLKKKHVLLLAVVLFVGIAAVFGDKGVLELFRLKKERDGILVYNASLDKENAELAEKIKLLENDKRYIGQIARKELGKLGKNEVVYKIETPRTAPQAAN
ncbi:MAG: hypothetical protein A2054_01520 [Deltaproteobacteria bacterium GWA2_55_10]|nr:MAG: hypothetical protein A2054_01520 [Deltaproteobacteria bacterium GWA2_55_10]